MIQAPEEAKKAKTSSFITSYGDYKESYLASEFTEDEKKTVRQTFNMAIQKLECVHSLNTNKINYGILTKDIGKRLVDGIDIINFPGSNSFRSSKSEYTFRSYDELSLIFDYEKINKAAKVIMDNAVVFATNISSFLMSKKDGYRYQHYSDIDRAKGIAESYYPYHQSIFYNNAGYMAVFWALMILTVDDSLKDKLSVICDFSTMMGISGNEICDILTVIEIIYYEEGAITNKSDYSINSEYIIEAFVLVLAKYGYVEILE